MNEKIKQYANLLFNPLEYDNLPVPAGTSPGVKALTHAGGLAVGYGGLGMLARQLIKAKEDEQRTKNQDKIKAYLKGKNQILSLDSSTRDSKTEDKLQATGASDTELLSGLSKDAALDDIFTGTIDQGLAAASEGVEPLHGAGAIAAMLAGGYGGYKMMDNKIDTDLGEELEEGSIDTENNIDKLLLEEYKRVRQKEASQEEASLADMMSLTYTEKEATQATWQDNLGASGTRSGSKDFKITNAMVGAGSIYAIAAAAIAYNMSKNHADANDPRRRRMDALRQLMQNKGRIQGATTFTDMSKTDDLSANAQPSKKTNSIDMPRKATSASKDIPSADPTDPYAELLG